MQPSRVIYKYSLERTDTQTIEIPGFAEVLGAFQMHAAEMPVLYALVTPSVEPVPVTVRLYMTGENIDGGPTGRFLGTFNLSTVPSYPLIGHLFLLTDKKVGAPR